MDTKIRQKETHIWEANWFMSLSSAEKLLWFFINDRCNNIGIWQPNMKLAEFHIGSEIDVGQFFDKVNNGKQRIIERNGVNLLHFAG